MHIKLRKHFEANKVLVVTGDSVQECILKLYRSETEFGEVFRQAFDASDGNLDDKLKQKDLVRQVAKEHDWWCRWKHG